MNRLTALKPLLLRAIILIAAGLLLYGQTFQYGFVFDDHAFIVDNPYIKHFSSLPLLWHSWSLTRLIGTYSFAINYHFNGLNPTGYHVFNFCIHLLATGLVWALADLLLRITQYLPTKDAIKKELPFIIALLFLVHPCQTQAVSYISQRFESMATVFYLATIYMYLAGRSSPKRTQQICFFGLSGIFMLLGLFTKETVVTAPLMLIASEWILFERKKNRKFYTVLILSLVVIFLLFSKIVQADSSVFTKSILSESHDGDVLTPWHYVLTQWRVFATFLRLLILPINQNLDYDYPQSYGLLNPPSTLGGLLFILGLVIIVIKLRRHLPLIAFGISWMLITFSINLVPRQNVIFEHKLYLISFGFILSMVGVLSKVINNRRVLLGICLGSVAVLGVLSFERNHVWKNDFILWDDVVKKSPLKARAHDNRGLEFMHQHQFNEALADFNKTIEIDPGFASAYNNRAGIYVIEGRLDQALMDYNKALEINPKYAEGFYNRGTFYAQNKNFTQAIADYNKAIELNPLYAHAYNNRGFIWGLEGNYDKAILDFNSAIALDPDYTDAYRNRAITLEKLSVKGASKY